MPDKMKQGFEANKQHFLTAHQAWLKARGPGTAKMLAPLVWATTREAS